jgi:hypothetical protein
MLQYPQYITAQKEQHEMKLNKLFRQIGIVVSKWDNFVRKTTNHVISRKECEEMRLPTLVEQDTLKHVQPCPSLVYSNQS